MLRLDVASQTIGSIETGQSKRMFTLCREDIISVSTQNNCRVYSKFSLFLSLFVKVFSAFGELSSVEIERNNCSDSQNKSES